MAAPVRIEAEAWNDLRFVTLARLLGLADADHALIKTARIWSWQAEHYTPEAPTYAVDADMIDSALGPGGATAMVRSRLAEETPDGYRIRGSRGRIEWLWHKRQAARAGGEATRRRSNYKTGPAGQPLGRPDGQPALQPELSPLVIALVPEERDSPARAIPPSTPPTRAPRPRRSTASETPIPDGWSPRPQELAKARELGLDGEFEGEQFRDNAIAKGHKYVDWNAAFRTWVRRAPQYAKGGGNAVRQLNGERKNPMRPM